MNLDLARQKLDVAAAAIADARTALVPDYVPTLVKPGEDLQRALNDARPGDRIHLLPGAEYVGPFKLPAKAGSVTLRTDGELPDRRVAPADAPKLAAIVNRQVGPVLDGVGAQHWTLDGLQIGSTPTGHGEIVVLQDALDIDLRRLLIIAGPDGQKRAIRGNGRHIVLRQSHVANIWREGQDSQAFCAWDGAGPYDLEDNYLEAASENVMFGGADSGAADRVPADIRVVGNLFRKRDEWRGLSRNVKNLFELKAARRVQVRGNTFDGNWRQGQNGYAILLKSVNQDGAAPWSVTEDVVFEQNVVRNTENGVNILGTDYLQPSGRSTRLVLRHNLLLTAGVAYQLGGEIGELVIDHETVENGYTFLSLYGGDVWPAGAAGRRHAAFAVQRLSVTNTLAYHNDYGVKGDGTGIGTVALEAFAPGYVWAKNVLAGGAGRTYPPDTWLPTVSEYRAQFGADFRLIETSTYRGVGTDGQDLGR